MLIRKTTAIEEKTCRRPTSQIKEVDQYCLRGSCPSLQANKPHYHGIVQGQAIMKDSWQ